MIVAPFLYHICCFGFGYKPSVDQNLKVVQQHIGVHVKKCLLQNLTLFKLHDWIRVRVCVYFSVED